MIVIPHLFMDISHILLTKCQATYITGWAAAAAMHDEMAVAMVAAAVIEPHKGRQWGGLRKISEFTGFWGALRYSHAQNFGPRYTPKTEISGRITKFCFELSLLGVA